MKKIISVIGAGGKTSLLHKMSDYYLGKKETVLLTTTTHMMLERDTDISCDIFSIIERIKNDKYCMAGKICDGSNKKIQALPLEILKWIMPYVDNILIEADGAKHYSLKYPLESEPVIFEFTTDVYLVLGLWDIGKYCKDVIFRFEDMSFDTISGLLKPKTGSITFLGQDIAGVRAHEIVILMAGFVITTASPNNAPTFVPPI